MSDADIVNALDNIRRAIIDGAAKTLDDVMALLAPLFYELQWRADNNVRSWQ